MTNRDLLTILQGASEDVLARKALVEDVHGSCLEIIDFSIREAAFGPEGRFEKFLIFSLEE